MVRVLTKQDFDFDKEVVNLMTNWFAWKYEQFL